MSYLKFHLGQYCYQLQKLFYLKNQPLLRQNQDLRKKIKAEADNLPTLAHLEILLDGEISKLAPGQVARGRALAKALVQSQRDTMVMAILPQVPERFLGEPRSPTPELPHQE